MKMVREALELANLEFECNSEIRVNNYRIKVDYAIPSAKDATIILLETRSTPAEFGERMVNIRFKEIKNAGLKLVCIAVVDDLALQEKLYYSDEVLLYNVEDIAYFLRDLASNPWYPVFTVRKVSGKEYFGLAPIGKIIQFNRVIEVVKDDAFIGVNPLSDEILIVNFDLVLRMLCEGFKLVRNDVKIGELIECMLSPKAEIKIEGWKKNFMRKKKARVKELLEAIVYDEKAPEKLPGNLRNLPEIISSYGLV